MYIYEEFLPRPLCDVTKGPLGVGPLRPPHSCAPPSTQSAKHAIARRTGGFFILRSKLFVAAPLHKKAQ